MSPSGPMGIERFAVQQKITMMMNRYEVFSVYADDRPAGVLAVAQQKRMTFKESVTIYADAAAAPIVGSAAWGPP